MIYTLNLIRHNLRNLSALSFPISSAKLFSISDLLFKLCSHSSDILNSLRKRFPDTSKSRTFDFCDMISSFINYCL